MIPLFSLKYSRVFLGLREFVDIMIGIAVGAFVRGVHQQTALFSTGRTMLKTKLSVQVTSIFFHSLLLQAYSFYGFQKGYKLFTRSTGLKCKQISQEIPFYKRAVASTGIIWEADNLLLFITRGLLFQKQSNF